MTELNHIVEQEAHGRWGLNRKAVRHNKTKTRKAERDEIRVMVIGALPPPLTGSTVPLLSLVDAMKASEHVTPIVVATGTQVEWGLPARVMSFFTCLAKFLWHVRSVDVVTTHLSAKGRVTLGPVIRLVSSLTGRKLILRNFGGALDRIYESSTGIYRALLKYMLGADYVLVETKALVKFAKALNLKNQIEWFPNSRPLDRYRHAGPRKGPLRLVCIGGVSREKGVDLLLDAIRDMPPEDIELTVFGQLLNITEQEIETAHPNSHYGGILSPDEVSQSLADFDVLMMPSRWTTEGYPGVIIEAYAAGLAVVTVDLPTIREIADEEQTALFFKMNSETELSSCIRRLCDDKDLLERLKEGALTRSKDFASDVMDAQFIALCRKAACHRQRVQPN